MRAILIHSEAVHDDVFTYYFKPEQPFHYSAGQFIEMTVPHAVMDERGDWRQFTLSSSPTEKALAITMRHLQPVSSFKRALAGLRPGDGFNITQAMGDFILPLDENIPLVWLAGGIGITPFRSMAAWLAHQGKTRDVRLYHSVGKDTDALFGETLSAAGVQREVVLTADISRHLQAMPEATYYISGPDGYVRTTRELLEHDGSIRPYQIVTDAFLGYA